MATFSSELMATPRGPVAVGQLAGDDLALDQELAVERAEAVDVDVGQLELGVRQRRAEMGLDLGLLAAAGAVGEREVGEVAGQPDARAHDDVALGAGATQPLAGRFRQVVESHAWVSLRRSWSRSRAASS